MTPEGQWPMPASYFTMAEMMKRAGYTTGDFGKWGLGFVGTEGDPLKQGFDEFYGYNCQRQSHNYYPDHLWQNDKRVELSANKDSNVQYAPELIQEQALGFINKNKQKPFFLYLSYILPHAALQVPDDNLFAAYKKQFNEKKAEIKKPWNRQGYEPQEYPRAAYATMVTRLDEYVGQVISMVKNAGIEKNTIIIFTR
jgi:arylsulfatase A-like enzyme